MGGALYAPPTLVLCLLLKLSWDNPYLKILDLANIFVADVPIKKNQHIWSPSPSEHYEISVQKPPMHERVKLRFHQIDSESLNLAVLYSWLRDEPWPEYHLTALAAPGQKVVLTSSQRMTISKNNNKIISFFSTYNNFEKYKTPNCSCLKYRLHKKYIFFFTNLQSYKF